MTKNARGPDYYQVRNWSQFQHYKDRNPTWIKMHFALLASEDWVMLDDASRLLAVVCMLVASRHEGRVPNKPAYLKRIAYLDQDPDLGPLISCGFLAEPLADASTSQAVDTERLTRDRADTEQKERKENTGADAPRSSSHPEPAPAATSQGNGSAEDRFWQLADELQPKGVARSMCGRLAGFLGGAFDEGVSILSDCASAKAPSRYLGAIIRDKQRAVAPIIVPSRDEPPWVSDARTQGYPVEREGKRWRMAGALYDDEGEQVGC